MSAIIRTRKSSRDRTSAQRFGVAIGATALALGVILAIYAVADVPTNLPLVAAVAVAAWYGGRGPGVLASVLSLFLIALLIEQGGTPATATPGVGEGVYLATFLLVASIVGAATESLQRERAMAVGRATRLEELNAEVEQQMEEVQMLSDHLQQSHDSLARALASAEDLASRTMRLQEATAALARAQTQMEVADAVLGDGLAAVGAARGFLARVNGERVEIVRAHGYDPAAVSQLLGSAEHFPLLGEAVRSGEAIWVRGEGEHRRRYGELYDRLGITLIPVASVAIPLRHGDEVLGALALFFLEPSRAGSATEALVLVLGQAAGDALFRGGGYDAEHAARKQAEILAQARAEVLGVVAHDLRNPLNLISSSASLLLEVEDLSPTRQRKLLEITLRGAQRMNRLIGDLLDATRLQAGRLRLDLTDVDARAVMSDAEEVFRAAAEERRIELRTEPPEEDLIMRADEGRLQQVIGNLVGNALKFTGPEGRVVLSARLEGAEVVFSVVDNGPGIPPEHVERLFDRFWQARDSDRRGAGLGLAIAKGIVDAHGGRMWVESEVGVGTTFFFAVPASTSRASLLAAGSAAHQ